MARTRRQRERHAHVVGVIASAVLALVVLGTGVTTGVSTTSGFETTRRVGLLDVVTIREIAPAAGAPASRRTITASPIAIVISLLIIASPIVAARVVAIPVVRARRLPPERCDECGYEVGAAIAVTPACPECGAARDAERARGSTPFSRLERLVRALGALAALVAVGWLLAALWVPRTVMRGTIDGALLAETTRWGLLGWRIDRFTAAPLTPVAPPIPASPPTTIAAIPLAATIAITAVVLVGVAAWAVLLVLRRRRSRTSLA